MREPAAGEPLPRLFVISDVHVGAGALDDFVPELEARLIAFLGVLSRLPQAVELVINGDFFDFATAEPWDDEELESTTAHGLPLCFTEDQSCRKLENIIESHRALLDALAALLAGKPGNRVVVLPGNHDADLFWPQVRRRLTERLGGAAAPADGLRFVLERQYVVTRSGERYWIEHGHQVDPPNSFFVDGQERWSERAPPIFLDVRQHRRLYECPGTLGLVRHINHWRPTYKSISYVKPYSRVLRALIFHKAFKEPGRPLMVLRHLVAMLGWDMDLGTVLADDGVRQACDRSVEHLLANLTTAEERELAAYLSEHGLTVEGSLAAAARTRLQRGRIIDCVAAAVTAGEESRPALQAPDETLSFGRDALVQDLETKALLRRARQLIEQGRADYVITGHTHDPSQKLDGRFTNGGCWIPNQGPSDASQAQTILFEHGPVRYRMTYVEIGASGAPRLRLFDRGRIVL